MQQILVVLLLGVALLGLNVLAGYNWLKWVSFFGFMGAFAAACTMTVGWVFVG